MRTLKEIINRFYKPTSDLVIYLDENYTYSISDLLAIIPKIIINMRAKSKNKDKLVSTNNNPNYNYIYTDLRKEDLKIKQKRIYKLEIIISIFDFLGKYTSFIFSLILIKNNIVVINYEKYLKE